MGFILTDEIIKNANTYIPLAEKAALAEMVAQKCLEDTGARAKGDIFPPLKRENVVMKSLLLMQVLLEKYLKIDTPDEFRAKDYDEYASAHLLNQLERYKRDVTLKDKTFDLVADYKEFEKYVNTAIFNIKASENDGLTRFADAVKLMGTPENIEKLSAELRALGEQK
ncbi:MAG: hypothetical protein IKU30_02225 [Clostridia bacterium]|nr:hypothetical protein [Clostridia bacterium]